MAAVWAGSQCCTQSVCIAGGWLCSKDSVRLLQRRGRELCSMLCGTFYLLLKVLSVAGQV